MNNTNQNNHNNYSRLYLFGKVIDRARRKVPQNKPTTEVVTYLVQRNRDSKSFVDNYAATSYYEPGTEVSFPVSIKTYNWKHAESSHMFNIRK